MYIQFTIQIQKRMGLKFAILSNPVKPSAEIICKY